MKLQQFLLKTEIYLGLMLETRRSIFDMRFFSIIYNLYILKISNLCLSKAQCLTFHSLDPFQ